MPTEKICEECENHHNVKKHHGHILCEECRSLDKYVWICKSKALKEYMLIEDDLENLEWIEVKNSNAMKLYNLLKIKECACTKYCTTLEDLNTKLNELKLSKPVEKHSLVNVEKRRKGFIKAVQKASLEEIEPDNYTQDVNNYLEYGRGTLKKIIEPYIRVKQLVEAIGDAKYRELANDQTIIEWIYDDKQNLEEIQEYIASKDHRSERRRALKNELKQHGLVIRGDSAYCSEFIDFNYRTLKEVVDMMKEMDWFFKCTDYPAIMKRKRRREKREWKKCFAQNYTPDPDPDSDQDYDMSLSDSGKKKAIYQWVKKGKLGIQPPEHMNHMIINAEKRIQEEPIE